MIRSSLRIVLVTTAILLISSRAQAQAPPAKYIASNVQRDDVARIARQAPADRDRTAILSLLPLSQSGSFSQFVLSTRTVESLLASVDANRLNKMLANAPGAAGTALVSGVAAPAILGTAIEYGTVLQEHTDTATTLRGNALGVAQLLFGSARYQYCPEISRSTCSPQARFLRRISGSVSIEAQPDKTLTGTESVGALLGDDYRLASWGARFDLTPSNNLDDPGYAERWSAAVAALQDDPAGKELLESLSSLFRPYVSNQNSIYSKWSTETIDLLAKAPEAEFAPLLERQVQLLAQRLERDEPNFRPRIAAVIRSYSRYFEIRDGLLRQAHAHKSSLEFVNHRPLSQPSYSRLRYIYSHQPSAAPTLLTVNAGFGAYDSKPEVGGQFRDVQIAAQIDRRLGEGGDRGVPILTFALYYQWMKEDALIDIGETDVLPGTAIPLPDGTASLLKTKGHIVAAQGKLTFRLGDAVKVPLALTWANRKELVDDGTNVVRGQLGMTFDLDQILH